MKTKYLSPYLAGIGLGVVLLLTIVIMGRGLGASGGLMRVVVSVEKSISPDHVNENPYLAKYGGGDKNPLNDWLVFEILGVVVGGLISGAIAGRIKKETNHGPRITARQRWGFAIIGGMISGFGARLAKGCTSGQALSGGATLVAGSWVFELTMFAVAYGLAYFIRRQWV